ncbi:MAG: Gfo/Idh/MocA family protein [Candidatus Sumerlaeaceae bacterium]
MGQIRIALLGCGGMGGAHMTRLRKCADAQVVALCDVSAECIEKILAGPLAGYEPRPQTFTDAAEMYATAAPDAVIIVTPHTMHFAHGMQALAAGCHVLMEKPMVTDSRQGAELADAASRSGKIFIVGYNTPCMPSFQYLRELIRSRKLGRLETVTGWQVQDWRRLAAGTWRQDPALSGGGQMYDSGAHLFNSLVWSIEQPVTEVAAFVDNLDTAVDINGVVSIRFEDGTLASISISGNSTPDGAGMVFVFENGRVEIDGWAGAWIRVFERDKGQVEPSLTGDEQTATDNFIDAILGRAKPQTTPETGLIQSRLMDAIYESARTQTIVKIRHQ